MYDTQRTITLAGTVVNYEWGNPHVYVHIRTTSDNGAEEVWEVEAGSPTMMERTGWFRDTLRVDDRVTVEANPTRNIGRRVAWLSSLQKADGSVSYRRGAPLVSALPQNPVPAVGVSGNWLPTTPAFVRFVGSPEEWPLTERAQAALAAHTDSQNGSQDCVSLSAPFLMAWADLKRIEVGAETTVIKAALIDDIQREIHMNTESHDQAAPTNQGHSIGRFEGDVLVVDTARFAGHASGIRTGVPSSSRKHLVERFELSSDRTRLTYSYELEDPEHLTQPVHGSVEWIHRPDLTYTSYDCNRDSAGRFLTE
jgi:hypothetical protein